MFIMIYELILVLIEIKKNIYFFDYKFVLIFFFEKVV